MSDSSGGCRDQISLDMDELVYKFLIFRDANQVFELIQYCYRLNSAEHERH